MSGRALRLVVAAALFLGWIGWLTYAALSKSREPVVSRAQAAAATHPVVAELADGADGKPALKAKVVRSLVEGGPAAGSEIDVVNLPEADGYTGPGEYLLLLNPVSPPLVGADPAGGPPAAYKLAGQQWSPGVQGDWGRPTVYRWSPDVEAQARKLFR